jgi:hypothetical protein
MSEPGRIRTSLAALRCFARGVPLMFTASPKTPLRVLAVMALDTLHELRHSQPMPRARVRELAMFLDFEASTNAAWDRKDFCGEEYDATRRHLEAAGLGPYLEDYTGRLEKLESRRPSIGGAYRHFEDVRCYREEVVRLSLAAAAAVALNTASIDEELRATESDRDLAALFRIALQCQVIDDILDYGEDLSAGLPSFLTATSVVPLSMDLTAGAERSYGTSAASFPVRTALRLVTSLTTTVMFLADIYFWTVAGRGGRRQLSPR